MKKTLLLLDADIVANKEQKEKKDLLSEQEAKIQAEIRSIAITSLQNKGELTQDYKE